MLSESRQLIVIWIKMNTPFCVKAILKKIDCGLSNSTIFYADWRSAIQRVECLAIFFDWGISHTNVLTLNNYSYMFDICDHVESVISFIGAREGVKESFSSLWVQTVDMLIILRDLHGADDIVTFLNNQLRWS